MFKKGGYACSRTLTFLHSVCMANKIPHLSLILTKVAPSNGHQTGNILSTSFPAYYRLFDVYAKLRNPKWNHLVLSKTTSWCLLGEKKMTCVNIKQIFDKKNRISKTKINTEFLLNPSWKSWNNIVELLMRDTNISQSVCPGWKKTSNKSRWEALIWVFSESLYPKP